MKRFRLYIQAKEKEKLLAEELGCIDRHPDDFVALIQDCSQNIAGMRAGLVPSATTLLIAIQRKNPIEADAGAIDWEKIAAEWTGQDHQSEPILSEFKCRLTQFSSALSSSESSSRVHPDYEERIKVMGTWEYGLAWILWQSRFLFHSSDLITTTYKEHIKTVERYYLLFIAQRFTNWLKKRPDFKCNGTIDIIYATGNKFINRLSNVKWISVDKIFESKVKFPFKREHLKHKKEVSLTTKLEAFLFNNQDNQPDKCLMHHDKDEQQREIKSLRDQLNQSSLKLKSRIFWDLLIDLASGFIHRFDPFDYASLSKKGDFWILFWIVTDNVIISEQTYEQKKKWTVTSGKFEDMFYERVHQLMDLKKVIVKKYNIKWTVSVFLSGIYKVDLELLDQFLKSMKIKCDRSMNHWRKKGLPITWKNDKRGGKQPPYTKYALVPAPHCTVHSLLGWFRWMKRMKRAFYVYYRMEYVVDTRWKKFEDAFREMLSRRSISQNSSPLTKAELIMMYQITKGSDTYHGSEKLVNRICRIIWEEQLVPPGWELKLNHDRPSKVTKK